MPLTMVVVCALPLPVRGRLETIFTLVVVTAGGAAGSPGGGGPPGAGPARRWRDPHLYPCTRRPPGPPQRRRRSATSAKNASFTATNLVPAARQVNLRLRRGPGGLFGFQRRRIFRQR